MSQKTTKRVAYRLSRPKPDSLLTLMVVLTRHTFRWTIRRKVFFWAIGAALVICCVAAVGSGYGFWATKKIMDFSGLQRETREQQAQLRESLEQADILQKELINLQAIVEDLMKQIDPRSTPDGLADGGVDSDAEIDQAEPTQKVDALKKELAQADGRLKDLQGKMAPVIERWNHTPSVMPTSGYVSSGFGVRIHPFFRTNDAGDGLTSFHSGIDIANEIGTPIQATANGVVVFANHSQNYGLMVTIRHSDEIETLYAHMQTIHVRQGQEVRRGDIIGAMGRTGRATGVHLHYEVRKDGRPINPRPFLKLQSQWLSGLK